MNTGSGQPGPVVLDMPEEGGKELSEDGNVEPGSVVTRGF